ncbi:hypothetical protein RI054_23g98630 [Pseudoscourfieldia marina]
MRTLLPQQPVDADLSDPHPSPTTDDPYSAPSRVRVPPHLVTDFITTEPTIDVDVFLLQMSEILLRAGVRSDKLKLAFVSDFLRGGSSRWWWSTRHIQQIDTWESFVVALRTHTSDPGIIENRVCAFHEMAQLATQSDREWAMSLREAHHMLPNHERISDRQMARKFRLKSRPALARPLQAFNGLHKNASFADTVDYALAINLPLNAPEDDDLDHDLDCLDTNHTSSPPQLDDTPDDSSQPEEDHTPADSSPSPRDADDDADDYDE